MDLGVDFTHSAVKNVPSKGPWTHVLGYTSGTDDIRWNSADWGKYANCVRIRINQGYDSTEPPLSSFDVLDIEKGAWTPAEAAAQVKRRVQAGYQWTTLYGSDANLAATSTLIQAYGHDIWNGHVDCILADWNLNQETASEKIGTLVHGMTCRGVQWASPSSNPHTLLPGTALTLAQANVDLNIIQPGWNPPTVPRQVPPTAPIPVPVPVPVPDPVPVPVPPAPPVPVSTLPEPAPAPAQGSVYGYVSYIAVVEGRSVLTMKQVVSMDGGVTWANVL